MKRSLLIVLLLIGKHLCAQFYHVEGVVVDAQTKAPLANAVVFINQSLKSVVTNSVGFYSIDSIKYNAFEVVVALKDYETLSYKAVQKKPGSIIRFELVKISDTVPAYDKALWDKWGFSFQLNLLGNTVDATECEVLNPEAVRFIYNNSSTELTVLATEPLRIINEGLGYMVTFCVDRHVMNAPDEGSIFSGYSYFRNLTTKRPEVQQKWNERRRVAYRGSINHFLKSVYSNTIEREGFEVHGVKVVVEGQEGYIKGKKSKDFIVLKKSSVISAGVRKNYAYIVDKKMLPIDSIRTVDTSANTLLLKYPDIMQVVYKNEQEDYRYLYMVHHDEVNKEQSSFLKCADKLAIRRNGLYSDLGNLLANGYMAWEKLAELLPSEYLDGL